MLARLRGLYLPWAAGDMQALRRYLEAWKERPSWQQSGYEEGLTLAFWRRKVAKAHEAASSKAHM